MQEIKDITLAEIRYLQNFICEISKVYQKEDIRISIFDGLYTNLCQYYVMIDLNTSAHFHKGYQEILNNRFSNYLETAKKNNLNLSNSSLLIHSWSTFELFISTFSTHTLTSDKKKKMLNKMSLKHERIKKELVSKFSNKYDNFNELELKSLEELKETNFNLIPSCKKALSVIKSMKKSYDSNDEYMRDSAFISNYGRLRNCIHSNFVFHGNESESYEFNHIKFNYYPEKKVRLKSVKIFIEMCIELRKICERIINNIEHQSPMLDSSYLQ